MSVCILPPCWLLTYGHTVVVVLVHYSTPPTRTEAFEEFKKDPGSEIHRILLENKGNEKLSDKYSALQRNSDFLFSQN